MMTRDEIFNAWAPPDSRWSPWVKPVLFATIQPPPFAAPLPEWEAAWAPPPSDNVALVIDLPGVDGVAAGLALAARGYQPVPLYNSVPGPTPFLNPTGMLTATSLIDVAPIVTALSSGAEQLQATHLPDGPPVFLLDANRRGEGQVFTPGRFDNRSISFVTDFPSANFLLAHGIRRAILVQMTGDEPQPDLAHTLRRWQEAGIAIELKRLDSPAPPAAIEVRKPSGFGRIWHRALDLLGLRRHALGGYGGFIPQPSSG